MSHASFLSFFEKKFEILKGARQKFQARNKKMPKARPGTVQARGATFKPKGPISSGPRIPAKGSLSRIRAQLAKDFCYKFKESDESAKDSDNEPKNPVALSFRLE